MIDVTKQMEALPISWAGQCFYHLFPYRRRVVYENINQVYGHQLNARQKKHLAQAFYSHVATSLKEFFLLRFKSEEAWRQKVEVRGHHYLLDIAAKGQGVLVLTGHFGNWECAPIGGILNFKAFQGQFHFIRRTFNSKWVEKLLFRRYYKAGLHVIPKANSLHQVCDALEKNHAVVFVMDQHAIIDNRDGVAVEFFGKKAGTYRSLASLSRHTGVPVVPAASYRLPSGKHVLEFHPPIPWQDYPTTKASIYYNTLAYNQALERIILAHPEQWSWFHKRWKLKETSSQAEKTKEQAPESSP